jgi:hypothetical protein
MAIRQMVLLSRKRGRSNVFIVIAFDNHVHEAAAVEVESVYQSAGVKRETPDADRVLERQGALILRVAG